MFKRGQDHGREELKVQANGPDRLAARRLTMLTAIAVWTFASCAHAQFRTPPSKVRPATISDSLTVEDPFEGVNRVFYAIHQVIDHVFLRPLALGYSHATATPVRKAVHNLVTEVSEPVVFGNDVLQLRVKRAAKTLGRFLVNATLGVGGLFDPATKMGLDHHDNGFGTTLGRYGVKPGPYLFIPLMGPTNFRDVIGTGFDFYSDPVGRIHYPKRGYVLLGIGVVGGLDQRAESDADLQQIESMGTDSYATLRSLYMQQREADIRGDKPVSVEELPSFDDVPAAEPTPGEPAAAPAALPDEPAPLPPAAAPADAPAASVAKPSAAIVTASPADLAADLFCLLAPATAPLRR